MTSRGSLLPFSRSPDRSTVQDVAHAALQSRSVDVIRLDGTLFHTYQLRTSPTFFYLLRVRPPPPPHLLRHEASGLDDEAAALQILGGRPDLRTPRLIAHCPRHKPLGSPYLITGPFPGTVLSHIEPSLSATALASIDHSLGRHVRRLAEVPGPLFGPVGPRSSSPARGPVASSSWAHTFASLLDTLLHDATSTAIDAPAVPVLPDDLGALVRQHRPALDAVVHPVLLLLQSGPDSNVVVDERDMSVVGLLDYSTAIWGDVFLCDAFYDPTECFARGFGRLPNHSVPERTRQYLYILYHSLLALVRHRFRPDTCPRDVAEARRNLDVAMYQLRVGVS